MKTRDWDALRATAGPIDRVAAGVQGRGVTWSPDRQPAPGERHWTGPPTELIVPRQWWPRSATFEDMTGRRFGRFVVVAYLGKPNPKIKARWLVRCTCGDYEQRSVAAIKTADPDNMCVNCRYLETLKRNKPREGVLGD